MCSAFTLQPILLSVFTYSNIHSLRIKMKGIADLLDSDMDETTPFLDENSILSSASNATNTSSSKPAPAKKGKKRQRVTMPKAKPKAQKAATVHNKKPPPKQTAGVKRKAADEPEEAEEDVDGTMDLAASENEAPAAKPKKKRQPAAKAKPPVKAVETQETEDDLVQLEDTPVEIRAKQAVKKTAKPAARVATKTSVQAKSKPQQFRSIITESERKETDETQEDVVPAAAPKQPVAARQISRTRQDPPFRRRAGSASDTERGEPNLRRKLGDITRKFENVDLKYRNLKEVGINEANINMEKLRKQCDATVQASNDLIASLKKELATQAPLAQEARKFKKQMQNQEDEMTKMRETTADISGSLTVAQNEIKALQAKLAAARSTSNDHLKTPGSAIKGTAQRSANTGTAEAQMKLDLYSDLTGLVVLSVKKTEEGDSYECIQTGHNGSKYRVEFGQYVYTDLYSITFPTLYRPRNCEDHELRRDRIFVPAPAGCGPRL